MSTDTQEELLETGTDPWSTVPPLELPVTEEVKVSARLIEIAGHYHDLYALFDCEYEAVDYLIRYETDYPITREELNSDEWKQALEITNPDKDEE